MKIELHEITIGELLNGYHDGGEAGAVVGFGGKLDIRPPYQREFIYDDWKQVAVIDTIEKNFPLNVMYWAVCDDGKFELVDGQQRTLSICHYYANLFAKDMLYWHNHQEDWQQRFLDYKLQVYFCTDGTPTEKLKWFETINIAGEKLTNQELRNAIYHGSWVTSARDFFSKRGCKAEKIASLLLKGVCNRQDYLETAIYWISNGNIEVYMGKHQHDPNANELTLYFQQVINWVNTTFPHYRKEMKGQDWGLLYKQFGGQQYDTTAIENEIITLMTDEYVTDKRGIYIYVLTRDTKHLNVRVFNEKLKCTAYERQQGVCPLCGGHKHYEYDEMDADHVTAWSKGGETTLENCQMLCKVHNRSKGNK